MNYPCNSIFWENRLEIQTWHFSLSPCHLLGHATTLFLPPDRYLICIFLQLQVTNCYHVKSQLESQWEAEQRSQDREQDRDPGGLYIRTVGYGRELKAKNMVQSPTTTIIKAILVLSRRLPIPLRCLHPVGLYSHREQNGITKEH